MGCLSHLIDPRFLAPLAESLDARPQSQLDLQDALLHNVPNKNIARRSLNTLLDLASRGGAITFEQGLWRLTIRGELAQSVAYCLSAWCDDRLIEDDLLRNRCAAHLDRGVLLRGVEYVGLEDFIRRPRLSDAEWARAISGLCDLRQLTGRSSRHSEADFLTLYRSADSLPISDDADLIPRIPRENLPDPAVGTVGFRSQLEQVRAFWWDQVRLHLGEVSMEDLSRFIAYAKDLLDLIFWGNRTPLVSAIGSGQVIAVSRMLSRFGLRAEDLSTVWRGLPSAYTVISRLSWGVRYLSNNLSHPQPPSPDPDSFVRVCNLRAPVLASIATVRSGHSLVTVVRPLRVLYRALLEWRDHDEMAAAAQECARAVAADVGDDRLLRREFSDRIRRLGAVCPLTILDALALEMSGLEVPPYTDGVLNAAGLISSYSGFLDSRQGRAYAELRLSLHAATDFRNRFNVHAVAPPDRYRGVWKHTLEDLVARVETAREPICRNYRRFSQQPADANGS